MSRTGRRKRPRPGRPARVAFTLVELLIVVAIIALLVTLLVPSLGEVRELARRSVCAANLRVLGVGWSAYFSDSNGKTPDMFNPAATDCISQFNFLVFTCTGNSYCNAGVLGELKMVPAERVYVCPTMESHTTSWFGSDLQAHRDCGSWENPCPNYWPPQPGRHSFMSYGTRRMRNYDDRNLAVQDHRGHEDPRDDHIMLWTCGTRAIENPSNFSFMADNFCLPETVMCSHVPGVNVLYLDGAVAFFRDDVGNVLYDNGITGWGTEFNWLHDDIWMVIDGYHRPPVGQGK